MTKAKITYDGDRIDFAGVGHAGYAEPGKDIVCASISTVCYMLARQAERMYDRQQLMEWPAVTIRDGEFFVTIRPRERSFDVAVQLMGIVTDALEMIAEQYPENFLLSEEVVG